MKGGYFGKLLEVDMTNHTTTTRPIDNDFAYQYIGGSGFGAKILWDETGADTDPLAPDNVLMFLGGPFTGTLVPFSGRHHVIAKSPLTGVWGESDVGGSWGDRMKRAGFAEVRVGFESSRPEFHETLDGKLEASMLAGAVQHLREAGFASRSITAYVLAGLPGQEAGEVELSIRHAASFGIRVRIAEYSPTPGSALWSRAVELSSFDLDSEPLTHNNSVLPMRWRSFTIEDLDRLKALTRRLEVCPAP